jgi:hypothetical protein
MKKYIIAGGIIAIAASLALSHSTLAYRGDPSQTGPNYDPQRHEEMLNAFENNDYNKWKELMQGRGRVTEKIDEQNFSRFSEMRRLMLDGKTDEANQIRTELGLGQGTGYHKNGDSNQSHGRNRNTSSN